ncbi:MAG: InlB B-repeat-containing protein, partial [Anaeroplasma bactoclasticum]|nr:InlB B-repeat-containing protein [Anaeroplasma bactoclasticum]
NQTVIPQLPVLTFEGYSFLGWYLDEKLENKAIEGTKLTLDIILYAKWEKQKIPTPPVIDERYSITFINNGYGEKLDSIENQTVIPQLPVLTFEGYSFQGWYLDEKLENKAIKGTKLTSDIILYAKWEKILLEKLDVFYEIENTDSFGEIQIEVTCGQNVTTYYMYSLTKIDIEKENFEFHTNQSLFKINNLEENTKYYIYLFSKTSTSETEIVEKEIITKENVLPIDLQVSFDSTSIAGQLKLTIHSNLGDINIWYILSSDEMDYTKEEIKELGTLYEDEVLFENLLESKEYRVYVYALKEGVETNIITKSTTPLSSIYEQFMEYFEGSWNMPGLYEKDGNSHSMPKVIEESGNKINVLDYGAVPNDSSVDNYNAFKASIAKAAAGDTIYIPNGKYYFYNSSKASSEYYAHIILKSNITLLGESKDGVVLISCFSEEYNETKSTTVIAAVNVKNVAIKNLTVSSNTPDAFLPNQDDQNLTSDVYTGPKYGITAATGGTISNPEEQGKNILIENVLVEKFRRSGIRIAKIKEVVVRSSTFQKATCLGGSGSGYGVCIQGINHDQDCTDTLYDSCFNVVENCQFLGPWLRHGTLIQYYSHNNLIRNNTFLDILLDAIDMHGEEEYSNEICYNEIKNTRKGAGIGLGNSGATHDATGRNTFIHDNSIIGGLRGIDILLGTKQTVIYNNKIKDVSSSGIKCSEASSVKIIKNSFTNVLNYAITILYGTVWGPAILGIPDDYVIRKNQFIACKKGIGINCKGEHFLLEENDFESMKESIQIVDTSSSFVLPQDSLEVEVVSKQSNYFLSVSSSNTNITVYYLLSDKEIQPSLEALKNSNQSLNLMIPLTDVLWNQMNYVYVLCVNGQVESKIIQASFYPKEEVNDSFINISLGEVEYAQVNIEIDNPNHSEIKYWFGKEQIENPSIADLTQATTESLLQMDGLIEDTTYYFYVYNPASDEVVSKTIKTEKWVHFNLTSINKKLINIYNASDFYYYVEASNQGLISTTTDLKVMLYSDIILNSDREISMITTDFKGTFDGQGHTIYNVKIIGDTEYLALYKRINNGTFKNTIFKNASVINTSLTPHMNHGTAVLAADLKGSIENVYIFDSTIESKDSDSRVGGIVGKLTTSSSQDVKVLECAVINSTIIGRKNVGGAIGFMDYSMDNSAYKQYVKDIYVLANIYGNENVGGVVGYLRTEIQNAVTHVKLYKNEANPEQKNFGQVIGFFQNSSRAGVKKASASSLLSYEDGSIFGAVSTANDIPNIDSASIFLVGENLNQYQTNLKKEEIHLDFILLHTDFDVATKEEGTIWRLENYEIILRVLV